MARRTIPTAKLAEAEQLLAAGVPRREVSRRTGIAASTLADKFGPTRTPTNRTKTAAGSPDPEPAAAAGGPNPPAGGTAAPPRGRRPDPRPRTRSRPRASSGGPEDDQLYALLSKAAVAPAIPAGIFLRCEFCAAHFATQGPIAAQQLVELSHDHPELRAVLVNLWRSWETYAWSGLLLGWLGIPILHHLAPDSVYTWVAPLAGMPPRSAQPGGSQHEHGHRPAGGATHSNGNGATPQPAAPEPPALDSTIPLDTSVLEGVDTSTLVSMASEMGFELDPDQVDQALAALGADSYPADTDDDASTEIPATGDEATGSAPAADVAPAAPAEPDPDAGV